jgi:hypothetical protein
MPDFKYFTLDEFACKETNANRISPTFVTRLDNLRHLCNFPFTITSGYRDPKHSAEVNKPIGSKGQHTLGIAADIDYYLGNRVFGKDPTRFKIVAAGRRTGKSRLAAWLLIVNALQATKGTVFYVAPTQGQARDIMWETLLELGNQ